LRINQGDIFEIGGSRWVVVDDFHNASERYDSVHCAPISASEECRLPLDVSLRLESGEEAVFIPEAQQALWPSVGRSPAGAYAALGLMKKLPKSLLKKPFATAHPAVITRIKENLTTWFALYTMFDLTASSPRPLAEEPPSMHPGTILRTKGGALCVVDHWGCLNEYPLLYVAPVQRDVADPCPLDVEITSQFQDLFAKRNFVRVDDFFLVDREQIGSPSSPTVVVLRHGLLHKISRAFILKFGHKGLLL
jgi:hypothetical protein